MALPSSKVITASIKQSICLKSMSEKTYSKKYRDIYLCKEWSSLRTIACIQEIFVLKIFPLVSQIKTLFIYLLQQFKIFLLPLIPRLTKKYLMHAEGNMELFTQHLLSISLCLQPTFSCFSSVDLRSFIQKAMCLPPCIVPMKYKQNRYLIQILLAPCKLYVFAKEYHIIV